MKPKDAKTRGSNRIILPMDESKEAKTTAQKALILAKKTKKEFVAMYVIDTPRLTQTAPLDQASAAWESILRKKGSSVLDEVEKMGKKIGVNVTKKLVEGIPEKEIVKEAKKDDIIVMECTKQSTLDRLLLGSVCQEVIAHSKSPLMIYQIKERKK